MAATRTIWLPIPRLITATVRRCASPERLATHDLLPLEVPDLRSSEAPVAVRTHVVLVDDEDMTMEELREHGGALHTELDVGIDTPERLAERLAQWMTTVQEAFKPRMVPVFDFRSVWSGASVGRGVRAEDGHRIAQVHDDGRAAQEGLRASLEANLVLVDGQLHHRVMPLAVEIRFETDDRVVDAVRGGYLVNFETRLASPRAPDAPSAAHPWLSFPIHRADEAMAFIRDTLDAEPAKISDSCAMTQFEVIDREAYERSDAFTDRTLVRDSARAFVALVAPCVAHQDDETLARYAEVRRADMPDPDLRDALLDLARRIRSAPRAPWTGGRDHAALVRESNCLVDRFERREMRDEHDVDALSALGIG